MEPVNFGVVVFPGSNCDHDAYHASKHVIGQRARFIWHKEEELDGLDVVILPGGFSYGDYLRAGAIARFSPIMAAVQRFAADGGLVMGICNGFQVLCEAGLLPGALIRNHSLRFSCKPVHLRVEQTASPFTSRMTKGQVLTMPIAHGEGNFHASDEVLDQLEDDGRVAFRYATLDGDLTSAANPNGSKRNIAGVLNEERNVLGMMPHPERQMEDILGGADGRLVFDSLLDSFASVAT